MPLAASDFDGSFNNLPVEDKAEVEFFITGNNYTEYQRLQDEGTDNLPIFFNPDKEELMTVVNHKSNIINRVGVTKFFEDQEIQIALLKALCPKCKFVLVKGKGDNL